MIGDPVPVEHALDRDGEILPARFNDPDERIRVGPKVLVNQDRAGEVKAMEKFSISPGPVILADIICCRRKERLINAQLDKYISGQLYWALHAPRQTGKTTFLLTYMKEINESGEGIACYVSLERAQGLNFYRGDVRKPAREMLITERAVHLDSLQERLKNPRIKRIVQPVITGQMDTNLTDGDDFQLAADVGLVEKAIAA